ncbi:DUF2721 domain-containing protein [Verminephrobacter sp. Larva24]|nr:DUF2721 domain-containing protein [Verminephrobacter sp. Larva24]
MLGRDITAGMLYGARVSLLVGLVSTLVALVFGILIGAVAGRLARIIDRARVVEDRARARTEPEPGFLARTYKELADLRLRGRLANGCIGLLTFCAFLIGSTIILLFLGETTNFQSNRLAVAGFLAGVASFLLALVCFLTETLLATRLLDFDMLQQALEHEP